MGSTEEPERKRRHLNHSSISPALKKASLPSADDKKVDATMLQYQNQKLEQQLDVQRSEIDALESKFSQLKNKQASHESSLQSVQNAWGLLMEKLEFLAVRENPLGKVEALDHSVSSKDAVSTYVPPEEAFLHRLLETGATESSSGSNDTVLAELTLKSSRATARKSVEHLVRAIDTQRAKREELFQAFKHELPNDEVGQQMKKIHDNLREVVVSLRLAMDTLHLKHKDLASQVHLWRKNTARYQAEIKLLTGELQETILDLENTRQKIAALRNQKDVVPGKPISLAGEAGDRTKEKPFQATKGLEGAVEEAKSLASQRLNELEEAEREKVRLTEQLHQVQELLNDEQYVTASHVYAMLTEQVEVLKKELERYQSLLDNLGSERDDASRCDKDASLKAEASEAAEKGNSISNDKIVQLESKLHNCITERNSLHVRLDETSHALERQDEVAEFKVMVSTLEKEMCMMQQQLDRYNEAACRAESLRAEVEFTSLLLDKKTSECKLYLDKLADQAAEVKSLQDEARLLSESEQELKLILDMHGSESTDSRDIMELKEAERSAWAEVEKFKSALDDHGLELRVKVANEAEAACQQRLATAETEISEFRQRLDASQRVVIEFNEAAKMKSEEHDAYLAEIETIGQAYEDMQTQNQRLLQQISKRDDYNIKLVSESVKAKQLHTSLSEENQALVNCIQHATSLGESHKQRVARLEQQGKLHLDQLGKAIQDGRQNASAVEVLKRRAAEAEKECLSTKTSLEAVQKELEHRKVKTGDIQEQLEKERMARKRVQEDLASLSCKMARNDVQYEGSSLIEKLQDEVKEYKAILKCSVCHDRQKEVVITKCYHLFCSPCIQRNLEIRHRKCPGCGVTFGQNDVRNVYI